MNTMEGTDRRHTCTMKLNPKYLGATSRAAAAARLFVEENGDPTNPTILWIHGYCQCRLSWDNQFENEELVSKFHMIRLDLRGHGLSDKIADPAAFQDGKIWADGIQAVISAARLVGRNSARPLRIALFGERR